MTSTVSLEQWKKLYDLATQIKELAPWEWLEETNMFAVIEPQTQKWGFVSVMGTLGEHLSVAVYLGADGLAGFNAMQEMGKTGNNPEISAQVILQTPQLQLSFEDRAELRDEDRAVIKQLGLKFRGGQSWPMFRSFRPGMVPWFIDAEEAQMLIVALQQTIEIAPRLKADPDILFDPGDENDDNLLVRQAHLQGDHLVWEDSYQSAPSPEPKTVNISFDRAALERLSQARRVANIIQVDFFLLPNPIHEGKKQPPYFPYMLLIVEAQSGMILGNDLLQPIPTLADMWGKIPGILAKTLAGHQILPQKMAVRSDLLVSLLEGFADRFNVQIEQSDKLKALDRAKRELTQWMDQHF